MGTYENYVVPPQDLEEKDKLKEVFVWLMENEARIKTHYEEIMPEYIKKVFEMKKALSQI